jgi:hypothetical protein
MFKKANSILHTNQHIKSYSNDCSYKSKLFFRTRTYSRESITYIDDGDGGTIKIINKDHCDTPSFLLQSWLYSY